MRSMREIHGALNAEREALVDELVTEVHAVVPFYRTLSPEAERVGAGRFCDLILSSFLNPDPKALEAWMQMVLSARTRQGAALSDLFRVARITRRIFTRRILAGGAEPEAIERLNDVLDEMLTGAPAGFQERIDETMQALEEVEGRYQNLYLRSPAMMQIVDTQGRFMAVSFRWLDVLGYTREEVIGRPVADFVTAASNQRILEDTLPKLARQGMTLDVPCQLVTKDGEIVDTLVSSLAVRNAWGEVDRFVGLLVDVTEQLKAEQALRESQERWRALVDLAPLSMCVQRAGVILWVNAAGIRLVGASSMEELTGRQIADFIYGPDRDAAVIQALEGVRPGRRTSPFDRRVVRLDGSLIHVQVIAQSILYEGAPATQLALVDVSARLEAEASLRMSEAQAKVIETQEETLRALSTPLIPLGDGVIALPLIGRITGDRGKRIVEELSAGVVEQQASVVIVDVTGVPEADDQVAAALARAAQTIRLLGAEVVLTGMQPALARTFVELGVDLGGMTTRGTLRDGISHALQSRAGRGRGRGGDGGRGFRLRAG
ncbi:PAS domain S-box protein [Chondromyces apiculatus]|uniref:RsbR, positive regulator of sigma-B n=1 Tax=Chondromyces apiculatus DSM 436 TaxID=1192034 RepID=A0A017T6T8_9BACT|nr:PAS domain S-box protein [Chondromyces apiculatus]EYF04727.1 RsbR, positive regulator of sigma-B [Chondromyces apiculatus DSM 436]